MQEMHYVRDARVLTTTITHGNSKNGTRQRNTGEATARHVPKDSL